MYETQDEYRTITSFDATESTVALCLTGPSEPDDVYAMPIDGIDGDETPTRLTAMNADLRMRWRCRTVERVTFENGDGGTVEAIAYLPREFDFDDPEPRPLIAAIHGGPMWYDAPHSTPITATGRGRDTSSFGSTTAEASPTAGSSANRSVASGDRVKATTSFRAWSGRFDAGWADEDRLFITGFSQGGVNTAYVIARTDMFAAAAPEHGIYDFYSLFGTGDHFQWYENDLGLPWEEPDAYHAMSSITEVGNVDTPTLITAGENDWRCPPSQAEQLFVSLKKQGVPTKLVIYPDEHHNIGAPKRARHRLETLTEWFERHDSKSE